MLLCYFYVMDSQTFAVLSGCIETETDATATDVASDRILTLLTGTTRICFHALVYIYKIQIIIFSVYSILNQFQML